MRVLGIAGSVRGDSHNLALLRAAAERLPAGAELETFGRLAEIPAYDEDAEAAGRPEPVAALRTAVEDADAVLIATPEYNHSLPGVLKNALDWVSRPAGRSPLRGKPALVVGSSTGMFGAVWAQAETRKVLESMGARVIEEELAVPSAAEHRNGDSIQLDEDLGERLEQLLAQLVNSAQPAASAA